MSVKKGKKWFFKKYKEMGTVWSYENATYFPFYKTFDNSCSNSEDNTGCIFSTKSVIIETNEDGNVLSYSLNTRYD